MIEIVARSINASSRGALAGFTGYGSRMSVTPSATNTSASPTFAQHTPTAPRSICHFATSGDLWVFACGRRFTPADASEPLRRVHVAQAAVNDRSELVASADQRGAWATLPRRIRRVMASLGDSGFGIRDLMLGVDRLAIKSQIPNPESRHARCVSRGSCREQSRNFAGCTA